MAAIAMRVGSVKERTVKDKEHGLRCVQCNIWFHCGYVKTDFAEYQILCNEKC